MSWIIAESHIYCIAFPEQETFRPAPQLVNGLDGGLQDLWRLVDVTPEMLAARQIRQVARILAVDVRRLVVVVAEGLCLDGIVLGVADSHVQDQVDVLVSVFGEELGDFGTHGVV